MSANRTPTKKRRGKSVQENVSSASSPKSNSSKFRHPHVDLERDFQSYTFFVTDLKDDLPIFIRLGNGAEIFYRVHEGQNMLQCTHEQGK